MVLVFIPIIKRYLKSILIPVHQTPLNWGITTSLKQREELMESHAVDWHI
jgi:hypothetical protein